MGDTALKLNEIMFYCLVAGATPVEGLSAIALNKQLALRANQEVAGTNK